MDLALHRNRDNILKKISLNLRLLKVNRFVINVQVNI